MNHPEQQYLDLMQSLLDHGDQRMDRTGVGTYSDFGRTLRFDLSQGQTPVFTTKRVAWRHALKEMLWFLRGETNIRSLLQGEPRVTIWSDWPHRRYVEETGDAIDMRTFEDRILEDVEFARNWGDLGPVYGKQWRRWMGADGVEHDQVEDALAQICDNPGSRRIIVEGWNVGELAQMTLPPCHKTYQFWVSSEGRLSLMLTQRSADVLLGVPFNMVGASVFLTIMAAKSGLELGQLIWSGGDVHLYSNHIDQAKTQIARVPNPWPSLRYTGGDKAWEDIQVEDFELVGYEPQAPIKAPVAV